MKSMITRILTAVIAIPLVILILVFGQIFNYRIITVAIALVTLLMTVELLTARKLHKDYTIALPCMIFSFITPLLVNTRFLFLPAFLFVFALFIVLMIRYDSLSLNDITFAVAGSFVITLGMSCLTYLCAFYSAYSSFFVAVTLAVPWMADAGAYFSGTFFGKHKLCPKISPKKTVEGFIGGSLFCVLASVLTGIIFRFIIFPQSNVNFLSLVIIGVLDAFVSSVGDLSFSVIKRNCKIKDYGSIFPGHGGMLDRCDSVIFTAPLVLTVHLLLPIIV